MKNRGFSLLELLVTTSLAGIMIGMAGYSFKELRNPSLNGAAETAAYLRQVRAKALASTRYYTVSPLSNTQLKSAYADSCSAVVQTDDPSLSLTLPTGASMASTAWSICYSPRGLSTSSADIVIGSKTVQVVMGGGVRII